MQNTNFCFVVVVVVVVVWLLFGYFSSSVPVRIIVNIDGGQHANCKKIKHVLMRENLLKTVALVIFLIIIIGVHGMHCDLYRYHGFECNF